ncbi:hypothetical protein MLD38_024450 [Melastoma candidum]|uniref:Uncharacterized protein n=1 Tax=Melastoma candidum TaxID=119954 RepID=A0ACB9NTA8_9MYRT|nr:hypothetical protein MLD38_024450 [Melastoma candidum]
MEKSGAISDAFFDSRPWLDSELHDEFFSVDGDFTPLHENDEDEDAATEGSPASTTAEAGKRKKLGEHFRESLPGGGRATENEGISRVKPNAPNKTDFPSPRRTTTSRRILKGRRSKPGRLSQSIRVCLERFVLCRPSQGDMKNVRSSITASKGRIRFLDN